MAMLAALSLVTACTGAGSDDAKALPNVPMQQEIGVAEGRLDLVVWVGYAEDGSNDENVDWVTPFERKTGCEVTTKMADSSDDMVALMRTGKYDGVSASGDSSVRMIEAGLVAPVNTKLVPNYADVMPMLKNEPYNSADGRMYGVPHGYGANLLMWRTDKLSRRPTSWDVIWERDSPAADHVAVYDSPTYIADAALYLRTHRPELGIKDVYALDEEQFAAAVDLLRRQRPMVNQYWPSYTDEIESYKTGDSHAGLGWQVTANIAKDEGVPVETALPAEGVTGWSDTWMLAADARNPGCMYRWMDWILRPKIQSEIALWFGEAPANPKACRFTGKDFCKEFYVGDEEFYKRVAWWRTPTAACGDDRGDSCVPYSRWQQAWAEIKG